MANVECDLESVMEETYENLDPGLLLASIGKNGEKNIMTIGWGLIGVLFRKPTFIVAVRKSRYSYKLLNETGVFTVNVPGEGMAEALDFCGTKSGRDYDKFKEMKLTAKKGETVEAPIIEECVIHFECRVMATTDVTEADTTKDVIESVYPNKNFHRLYHGEITKIYRN